MIVLSFVVKAMYMSQCSVNFRVYVGALVDLTSNLRKHFKAVVVKTQIMLLFSLSNRNKEQSIMLISKPPFRLLKELDCILNTLILPTTRYGDDGVFDGVKLIIQLFNHLAVH